MFILFVHGVILHPQNKLIINTGRVDLVLGKGQTVEIVDFKSTPKPDQYAERYILERYRRQLEIYAWLVENCYGLEEFWRHKGSRQQYMGITD